MDPLNSLTTSYANVDLHSASSTRTPNFVFPANHAAAGAVSLLRCKDPAAACIKMKEFLLVSFHDPALSAPGIVRMECLELHSLSVGKGKQKEGWMLLHEDAAFLDNDPGTPVTIAAILLPGDPKVRWFYTLLSVGKLLRSLDRSRLIDHIATWHPGSQRQHRFAVYIREAFLAAVSIPHAPDYSNSLELTDCCPDIIEPDTAIRRLEGTPGLHYSNRNMLELGIDLSDDRYLLELHPAEREVASLATLKCAEYLLVKRSFFKQFFYEIYRSDLKKIDPDASSTTLATAPSRPASAAATSRQISETPVGASVAAPGTPGSTRTQRSEDSPVPPSEGAGRSTGLEGRSDPRKRVRTENAHRRWLETAYGFKRARCQTLVVGWRELGFLDEGRYLDIVREGGMLESLGLRGEDIQGEEDGDDMGTAAGAEVGVFVPAALAARRRELNLDT